MYAFRLVAALEVRMLMGFGFGLLGDEQVVISDFPDLPLVNNLKKNVEINIGKLAETGSVANTFVEVRMDEGVVPSSSSPL